VITMLTSDALFNLGLLVACYVYILLIIFLAEKVVSVFHVSRKSSRKFLHSMIGNFVFIIPFFTFNSLPLNFPFFVAVPFVLVTFLATPYSPFKGVSEKLKGLSDITGEGHQTGLVLYAISYTVLALLFSAKPYVIAAGILPMAYGDASAALIGEKYGKRQYRIFAKKSLEGSLTMFTVTFVSFVLSIVFFSFLYPISVLNHLLPAFGLALVATLAEAFSPLGVDNITVPALSALTFLLLSGSL
jgi:phytol kinase